MLTELLPGVRVREGKRNGEQNGGNRANRFPGSSGEG
jgi:hypothetical protein